MLIKRPTTNQKQASQQIKEAIESLEQGDDDDDDETSMMG